MPETAAFLVAGLGTGLLAADQGGFYPRTWPWAALAFGAVAALILLATPGLRITRSGIVLVGGLALLCAWTAISAQWSLSRPRRCARRSARSSTSPQRLHVLLAAAVGATPLLLGLATAAVATACYSLVERAVRGRISPTSRHRCRGRSAMRTRSARCARSDSSSYSLAVRARSHTERLILLGTAVHSPSRWRSRESRLRRRCGCRVRRRGCTACRWPALGGRGSSAGSRDARRRRRRRSVATPDVLQARRLLARRLARRAHAPALGTGAGVAPCGRLRRPDSLGQRARRTASASSSPSSALSGSCSSSRSWHPSCPSSRRDGDRRYWRPHSAARDVPRACGARLGLGDAGAPSLGSCASPPSGSATQVSRPASIYRVKRLSSDPNEEFHDQCEGEADCVGS